MKINTLTHSEELLMNILWKLNSAYMKDVMEAYPEPKPHQNTVSTFMKILVEKEFLITEKEGRIFKYSVAIPYDDYRKFVLRNFAENYFNHSVPELVKTLLDEQLLTTNELINIAGITRSEKKDESPISDFINEITSNKKEKKKGKKKDKKKKK
ncbi:BlaI/MecI/CopY family transcriptional regulator [Chryseobacterium sp. HSC-36S06]|uniref:BlaI/MecI/CopY family transcriptional regulator n=1 Tax=Chryseobacterium sp. HSC-36S06 TaxID=2910970 RepID=UPI00209D64D9|nr:BlaI/MecI/CopY family transcriptional regulator [Chryseobacterium sp. HSC-36S06]MCP2038549.1 putative transcriptional regulator [Chryseobacterium sp. HSC-36S06]